MFFNKTCTLGSVFVMLCIWQDSSKVLGVTVTGDDKKGLLGDNPLTLTCAFTMEAGEAASTMVIRRQRSGEPSFSDIAIFNIPANVSAYSDTSLQDRSTLRLLGDSASIIFNSLVCMDAATYQCYFSYYEKQATESTADTMNLVIEAKPSTPTIPPAYNLNDKVFAEYEELEVRCEGDVGLPTGNFVWFGYLGGNHQVDFTTLANPGQPTEIGSGDHFCAFRRESILKLNLTRDDDDLVIRCVVNHTTLDPPPQPDDICDVDRCRQTGPIEVLYPIRREDLYISSNPAQNQHISGSSVTLKCDVEGNPTPEFYWKKDGDETVISENNEWSLTNMALGDSGTYRCYAQNNVSGVTYDANRAININVVTSTTTPTTTATSPTTTKLEGGKTDEIRTGGPASLPTGGPTAPSAGFAERHDLDCSAGVMHIHLPLSLFPTHSVTLRDPTCKVTSNGTHLVTDIGLNQCGTTVTFTNDSVIFNNDLLATASNNPGATVATIIDFGLNSADQRVPVSCIFPRESRLDFGYIPLQRTAHFYEKQYGHLDFEVRHYQTEQYRTLVPNTGLPVGVPLNTEVFIDLFVDQTNHKGVGIFVDSCIATPTTNPADPLWYPLVKDGCPMQADVRTFTTPDVNEFRFSFLAFKFTRAPLQKPAPSLPPSPMVYLHCQVSACPSGNCSTSCHSPSTRTRRSADQQKSHLISTGPFYLKTDDHDQEGYSTAVVVATMSVAAVATLVAMVAIVAWRRSANKLSKYRASTMDVTS